MTPEKQRLIDQCLEALEQGTLSKQRLREAFQQVASDAGKRQDMLYLQAAETGLHVKLLGMRMVIDGQYAEQPDADEPWPYNCVLDAIRDGWRVISFPNMALCLDENRTYGLGFEYILERWG